jgi:rubrerythrin
LPQTPAYTGGAGLIYSAAMTGHWKLSDIPWNRFEPGKVDPALLQLVKAASLVERNGEDYSRYLCEIFAGDAEFQAAARLWGAEEIQHGQALGRWAELADRGFDHQAACARFSEGYHLPENPKGSKRGSRAGELIARCMVETGTSTYYTALAEAAREPVLQEICRRIAADELRHYKLFYTHLKRYLEIEKLNLWQRLWVALTRIAEAEDDELGFAYHAANEREDAVYFRARAVHAYLRRAYAIYRRGHVESGMAMIFKAVGLKPNGFLEAGTARLAWWAMKLRAFALEQGGLIPPRGYRAEKARIPPAGRGRAIA